MLTFPAEVQLIWRRKISSTTALFLLIRYCTLSSKLIFTYLLFDTEPYHVSPPQLFKFYAIVCDSVNMALTLLFMIVGRELRVCTMGHI